MFLTGTSSIQYSLMCIISIQIYKKKKVMSVLRLDYVVNVPNLDRRLFSVNSFINKGNNWVHFDKYNIQLVIQNSPTIKSQIISSQSNKMVVYMSDDPNNQSNLRISRNIIYSTIHRSDGVIATLEVYGKIHLRSYCE